MFSARARSLLSCARAQKIAQARDLMPHGIWKIIKRAHPGPKKSVFATIHRARVALSENTVPPSHGSRDRKSVAAGKRVDHGGRRIRKQNKR